MQAVVRRKRSPEDLILLDLQLSQAAEEALRDFEKFSAQADKAEPQPDGVPPVVEGGQGKEGTDLMDMAMPLAFVVFVALLIVAGGRVLAWW
jgi:hypothetical protein